MLIKRGSVDTGRHTGRRHVKMKAEVGVMGLQAKEHQGRPAATRSQQRGLNQALPHCTLKELSLPAP